MRAALFFLALLASGCPAGLEEQQHISKLRVLAVRADPAELILEADAGLPAAILSALAVDPSDAGIAVRYALCTDLSGVPAPTLDCPGDAGIDLPATGALSARLDLSDPRILAFAASVGLDGGAFDAGAIAQALDQGVPLLVGFTASTDSETLSGFQTLTLRTSAHGPANLNPELIDLEFDGGVRPGETTRITPVTAPKDDATKKYGFSFFSTAGSLSSLRSTDTTASGQPAPTWVDWTTPDTSESVRLWVVVRDGRGGTAFIERVVLVR
jgi:hypothetical protein